MANLDAAKSVTRGLRREVKEAEDGFSVAVRDQNYVLRSDDIDAYLTFKPEIKRVTETQLYTPGRYEHVIQFEGTGPRRLFRRDRDDPVALDSADGTTRIEIGRPTTSFCLCLTDTDEIDKELRRFALLPPGLYRGQESRPFNEMFRLYTIKVKAPAETSLGRSRQRLHELAEAATFHFAYGQGLAISFTKSWERTYYWIGRKQSETVQFPLRIYNSELIGYYNLALASDSLILGYLALYKILEYFYTSVSENALHQRVREELVSPDFAHTKTKKLRELIRAIRQFDVRLDELASLRLVLTTYFERDDLRRWVEDYEAQNGRYFTEDVTVFSNSMRIDVSDNSIVPNIATRIYTIRNALVHNKEGEVSRFIPYSGQEEVLLKEVQILLHLAEQLIIKTGKDL